MRTFVISDLHMGHKNILRFTINDGQRLRPFRDIHEMHSVIMDRWCQVVTPQDKIYVLGDVAMTRPGLELLRTLPGKKRLIRGNHDLMNDKWYHDVGFRGLYGVRQINGVWLTHVPMHPQSMGDRVKGNIHGHLHMREITKGPFETPDNRYFNACVERLEYTPVLIETIIAERKWA
jgi:calcineurin-like phosphoesterase family protein